MSKQAPKARVRDEYDMRGAYGEVTLKRFTQDYMLK